MVFKSKLDKSFIIILSCSFLLMSIVLSLPMFLDREAFMEEGFEIFMGLFLLITICFVWIPNDIVYRFEDECLYLRAGFLFTRIPYNSISSYRKLEGIMDALSGFNLLSSSKGIAILSNKVILGEVKISPYDSEEFIQELERRMKKSKQ